ncbi:hypothetical protein LTR17_005336 [Elasticomyces elasticus]|nr:hypothetical protein LTR17_005336 [Elasticomyces elasticus]
MAEPKQQSRSRKGCLICKRRHIKCDEQGPPCANCRVRNLGCFYTEVAESKDSSEEPSAAPASTASRRLELELFHQWSTDTYRSLIFDGDDETVWREAIPHLALDFDYLLNAIFAISALHISSMSTSSRSKTYQMAALEYQNLAITCFRNQDLRCTSEASHSMCAFSMIQLVLTVAFASYLDGATKESSILDDLTVLFNLLEGTTSIIASARTSLLNGPLGAFVRQSSHTQAGPLNPNAQLAFEKLRMLRDEEYTALSALATSTLDAASTYESTSNAIDKLEICFGLRSENKLVVCFRWFATLDAMFVHRISQLNPLALLITMHWAILLANIGKEKWWARSSGKALVAEISGILSGQRREWFPMMSFVYREVGLPS